MSGSALFPGRGPVSRRTRLAATVACAWALTAGYPLAQAALSNLPSEVPAGGEAISLGVDQRLSFRVGSGDLQSRTNLSLAYRTETRTEQFEASAAGSFRTGTGQDVTITPRYSLSYARQGARSALTAEAGLTQREIDFIDAVALAELIEQGTLVSLEDLAELEGTGLRTDRTLQIGYAGGQGGPMETSVTLRYGEVIYDDVTPGSLLRDLQSGGVDLGLGLALNAATRLDIGAGISSTKADGGTRRDTRSLSLGYGIERPRGALHAGLSYEMTPDGNRTTLSVGRRLEFPLAALDASLGLTQEASGGRTLTGSLDYVRETRTSTLGLAAEREVQTGSETELVATTLTADYGRELTRTLSLDLGASWAALEQTGADGQATTTTLEASVGYALTEEWSASLGARHLRRDGASTRTQSELFVGLGRSFAIRP